MTRQPATGRESLHDQLEREKEHRLKAEAAALQPAEAVALLDEMRCERDYRTVEAFLANQPAAEGLDVRADVNHALEYVNKALDKASYGDSVEGDLLEAHATLDTMLVRLAAAEQEEQP